MYDLKYIVLTVLMVGIGPGPVRAQTVEPLGAEQNSAVTLTVKPHICVAPRGESSCISRVEIYWQSTEVTDVCLYVSLSSETLQCWQQRQSGSYEHKVTLFNNLDYWLTPQNQQHMLAKSSVKFAALKPHRKHSRRRNHLPWSIQSL